MKKVINITLGGIVFAIEEDAYTALSKYLDAVKQNLSKNDDYAEIAEDIEGAIAEKFVVRKRNGTSAVTTLDVSEVTKEMGSPSDFGDDTHEEKTEEQETEHTKKRFYRDTDDAVLAGVASGIAKYFDIDPVIVRLIFVISVFFNGFGILAYIILWLVVPPALTTAQKFAMRGEKVTIKEITDQVKKNLENFETVDFKHAHGLWAKFRKALVKLFEILGSIVRFFMHMFRYVLGFPLILAGAFGIAGLVSAYSILLLSENVLFPPEVHIALEVISNNPLGIVLLVALFIAIFIPLLVCIFIGSSLIRKNNRFSLAKSVTLGTLWIISLMLLGTTAVLQSEQVITELEAKGYNTEQMFPVRVSVTKQNIRTGVTSPELWNTGFTNDRKVLAISEYLASQQEFVTKTHDSSHVFCSIQNLDSEETLFPVYIWAYCSEYTLENGELQIHSGTSLPVRVSYPNELSYFNVSQFTHTAPRDGALFARDVQELFPKHIQDAIAKFDSTALITEGDRYALRNIQAWEEVQHAILSCNATSVFQTHSREVTLELKNGGTFYAIEPEIDMVFDVVRQAEERCGRIIQATE